MSVVLHKKFIQSFLKKKDLSEWERESDFEDLESEEDVKPKKKRRITIYNKFIRITMPTLRGKYPGEKQGYYLQIVGAMWRSMSVKEKKSFAKQSFAKKSIAKKKIS
jgi:hypothetical protein